MFIVKINPNDYVSEEKLNTLDEVLETTTLGRADDTMVYKLIVKPEDSLPRFQSKPFRECSTGTDDRHTKWLVRKERIQRLWCV